MRSLWLGLLLVAPAAWAEVFDFDQAVARALEADPRIEEREHLVSASRALLEEALGSKGLIVDVNAFLALAPTYDDGLFTNGSNSCQAGSDCELRSDTLDFDGVTPWANLQFAIIKPLYTFGKIENYAAAAQGNVDVKRGDVRLQRGATRRDVATAYYGYLTARDIVRLLTEVDKRLSGAQTLVESWLDEQKGGAKQSDLFALQAGIALAQRYRIEAEALQGIAMDGLKVLTGVGMGNVLEVADRYLKPVPLPPESLEELTAMAMEQRPEMEQLEAGLRARRALVEAKKSEENPNVYAGIAGSIAQTPGRFELDNPYVYDPFNHIGVSPVVGIQWQFSSGVTSARAAGAQAELDALISKSSFARQGIPFQVAEAYRQVHAYHGMVEALMRASKAGRRWMMVSFADFEAGLEEASKVADALQVYVLAYSDYLQAVNDYNLKVVQLREMTGDYQ
jgi:outer membrane protein TolC